MEYFLRYLKRKQNRFQSEFQSPRQIFDSASETLIGYFRVSGAERLSKDYNRANWRLIFLVSDLTLYIVVSIWCLTVLWGQLTDVVFCLVTLGFAIQGFAKIGNYTDDLLYELHVYNQERFNNVRDYEEVQESLLKTASICKVFTRLFGYLYTMLTMFIPAYTIVASITLNKYQLPFGFFFPWIDPQQLTGYLINLAYHFLQVYEASFGLLASDTCFLFLIMHAIGQLDVIVIYLRKLNEMALKYEKGDDDRPIYNLLDDIVEKHQEHMKYMRTMDRLLKAGFFVNFGCMIVETVASLYVQTATDGIWYPGMIVIMLCVVQLFVACALGTAISIKNDEFINEIYNVSWYSLPIQAQQSLRIILRLAQHPVVLSDGFSAVDLFSFVEIYKKIYTYFAMLQSFS